jgi:hypothetical protein
VTENPADLKAIIALLENALHRIDLVEARMAQLVAHSQKEHHRAETTRHLAVLDQQLFRNLDCRVTALEAHRTSARGVKGCVLCEGSGWQLDRFGQFDECACVDGLSADDVA